ncbi:hypothetical protein GLW07_08800 [Bacillus hwajinpoensis]|uniref:Uncharacterized protein n=1 Tax=Guptibacillus hwajinpoensis TaxID=208199 RepID=A0A845EY11_9BACL|nr:hypothetical protein [Pseudalkalibacillus hwajinpoensis]MYL63450.1 hypothetical protein [Pseudalkalibacillus hwajinpoensis]
MLFSKLKTALITSILTWLFCIVLMTVGGIIYKLSGGNGGISVAIGGSFLMILYLIPAIIIIGIPISAAADQLTAGSNHRKFYSYIVHNGVGILLFLFVFSNSKLVNTLDYLISTGPWLLVVIVSASLFWNFDEKEKLKSMRFSINV